MIEGAHTSKIFLKGRFRMKFTEDEILHYCQLVRLSEIEPEPVEWLWYPYIPMGKVTIIQGDPGEGKSTLAMQLTAAVTRGEQFGEPDAPRRDPAYVLYVNAEDGLADTIRPRLNTAGADCHYVIAPGEDAEDMYAGDGMLKARIVARRPKLVILDPLQAYLGSEVDMHRANEIRPVMRELSQLAEQFHCAIVLIGHMNKRMGDKSVYRGLGSIDITAAARSVLIVTRDPKCGENRVIFQVKNSLAPEGEPVAFSLTERGFTWLGAYEASLTDCLEAERSRSDTVLARAKALILETLGARKSMPASEIYDIACSEGIAKSQLTRARQALKIPTWREDGKWIWGAVGSAGAQGTQAK